MKLWSNPNLDRLLARLYTGIDVNKSMAFAKQASALGDIPASQIQGDLLDSGLEDPNRYSSKRLSLSSQLLAKLDPCFSFNVLKNESLRESDFITFIQGIKTE